MARPTPCSTSGSVHPSIHRARQPGEPGSPRTLHSTPTIRDRFGALIERALRGELEDWAASPRSALAQVIVLDQFTRNVFRDTPRAFAGDARALRRRARWSARARTRRCQPFNEPSSTCRSSTPKGSRCSTRACVSTPDSRRLTAEQASGLDYAERHRAIIERFGRFPHRNRILGRQSTPEEIKFLKTPGSGF